MELRKFVIVDIQRKEDILKSYSFGDWSRKHPEKRKDFFYTFMGNDEKTYFYRHPRTPQRFTKGQTIRCWCQSKEFKAEPNEYDIQYHFLYKTSIFSEYLFRKAVEDYINRNQESVKFYKKEIERLKAFID